MDRKAKETAEYPCGAIVQRFLCAGLQLIAKNGIDKGRIRRYNINVRFAAVAESAYAHV